MRQKVQVSSPCETIECIIEMLWQSVVLFIPPPSLYSEIFCPSSWRSVRQAALLFTVSQVLPTSRSLPTRQLGTHPLYKLLHHPSDVFLPTSFAFAFQKPFSLTFHFSPAAKNCRLSSRSCTRLKDVWYLLAFTRCWNMGWGCSAREKESLKSS